MMETVSLREEKNFLRIADGNKIFYGGDQAWFDFTVGQHSGCGTVAAANITAYLAGQQMELRNLYHLPDLQKEHFLTHMMELYDWVKPWKVPFVQRNRPPWKSFGWGFGVWPPYWFARGVKQFARSRGICMEDRRISSRCSMEELTGFIRDNLERDCPVAMLIGRRPRYERELVERPDGHKWMQTHFSMHWVVITMLKMREENVMVKVSTWGGYSWLDLEAWHRAGGIMPGLVGFQWTKNAWDREPEGRMHRVTERGLCDE